MSEKKTRPSPSKSATLYKIGTKKTGNDGNIWVIDENKNGVKQWKLYKKKSSKLPSKKSSKKSSKKTSKKSSDGKYPLLYIIIYLNKKIDIIYKDKELVHEFTDKINEILQLNKNIKPSVIYDDNNLDLFFYSIDLNKYKKNKRKLEAFLNKYDIISNHLLYIIGND